MTNSNDALRAALGDKTAVEKIAILSNQDWTLARVDMAATLDMIHEIAVAAIYPASPVAGGDLREVRTTDGYPVNSFSLQDILAEMLAVATASLTEDDEDILDDWPIDCRADVDRWQAVICGHLATLNQPAAPVEAVEPAAWLYSRPHPVGHTFRYADKERWDDDRKEGYVETPLYAHPPEPAASTVAQGDR